MEYFYCFAQPFSCKFWVQEIPDVKSVARGGVFYKGSLRRCGKTEADASGVETPE